MQYLKKEVILQQGRQAIIRTGLNAIVCLVDAFPGIGWGLPFLADLAKFGKATDLTPDVPKKFVWGMFGVEVPFAALPLPVSFPSYVIPAIWQLAKDWPRIKAFLELRMQQNQLR